MKILITTLLAAAACGAQAHETHTAPAKKVLSTQEHAWGREGDPRKAVRTIALDMADTMRFTPSEIRVKRGQTVTFVVGNSGKTMHEMVLGTEKTLRSHAEHMKAHPAMEHDEPYMVHVKPGERRELTWTFTRAGTFLYGCLIPGHWDAGMKGAVVVATQ